MVCDAECKPRALACPDMCGPGEVIVPETLDDLTNIAERPEDGVPCGECGRGHYIRTCGPDCAFGEATCAGADDLCIPMTPLHEQICALEGGEMGVQEVVCGADCEPEALLCEGRQCEAGVVPEDPTCGLCGRGTRTRVCVNGIWGEWSACEYEIAP